ncbi:MAG: putative toxin-antitoxin system toxin component, PIN family [Actinobacteria bacterium]|nr:putative toxin-antitoxin system toxin component, PIN family [Actinomycetota bacterium]MBU1943827.1 putative toxin-antitoxin system toxin component, PIN family [Actinomycetota bacterium]MBU2689012.1 putative toxin-antitoxin system toxin component, PIN family [Actinomycetota bacterium]
MIVLIDTNVLVSAIIARGNAGDVLGHCLQVHEVVLTRGILAEFEQVLRVKLDFPPDYVDEAVAFLGENVLLVGCERPASGACRDPDDDWILAGAQAANANCIVTGDDDLLVLRSFAGIRMVRPADFWRFEASFLQKP